MHIQCLTFVSCGQRTTSRPAVAVTVTASVAATLMYVSATSVEGAMFVSQTFPGNGCLRGKQIGLPRRSRICTTPAVTSKPYSHWSPGLKLARLTPRAVSKSYGFFIPLQGLGVDARRRLAGR